MQTTNNKLKVTFDGKEYIVEVRETNSGFLEVEVNGQVHQVSLETLGATTPESPRIAEVAPVAQSITESHTRPIPTQPTVTQANLVSAPMPGDIVKICVKAGDTVSIGQELLVLEAMKMKNVIRSPQAGTVTAVEVSTGQSVKYGAPLVRFG
jgi:biotin carboxyl carrier protein